jgi:hypothetical protein
MVVDASDSRQLRGFCRLCIARCGTIATVESGRFTRLDLTLWLPAYQYELNCSDTNWTNAQ